MEADRRSQISVCEVSVAENVQNLKLAFNRHLHFDVVKDRLVATMRDYYMAVSHTVWDHLCSRWILTEQFYRKENPKKICFISMEFCMGRALGNTILNVNITDALDEAMYQFGIDIEDLEEIEADAGLGNGGLGRLSACFLDSMATIGLAAYGYGIRYEHGAFHQTIRNGWQIEEADEWLRFGNPWEKKRPEAIQSVYFGGRVVKEGGCGVPQWVDMDAVTAIPYDIPIPGYRNNTCNTLRLWAAKASKKLDLHTFFQGDYINAVLARNQAENISRVLYPIDHVFEGKQLRLRQEYFLVAASIRDILRRFRETAPRRDIFELNYAVAIHINDTHPALAIPELLRILIDEEHLEWSDAWEIAYQTFTHTNHVAQTEALKSWSLELLLDMLPRHVEIIEAIDRHFRRTVLRRWPNDTARFQRMSLFQASQTVRGSNVVSMDHLSIVGSRRVNGVSAVQTHHLKTVLFRDFADLWPMKFINLTNGVTPRRWLLLCNPGLADLLMDAMHGDESWITSLSQLGRLKERLDDAQFRNSIMRVKVDNKNRFAAYLKKDRNISIDPSSLFDVQVKRVDEYKRHLLCCLHVITMYNRIKADPWVDICPRTVIIGGNASPGNRMGKLTIKLINCLVNTINSDPVVAHRLKVVFLNNYRVSTAERVIPAADLSEQIPCVGTEASGTGNMKFMLNGALTIGTMDGVNIEIAQEVGQENFFSFGYSLEEVKIMRANCYDPSKFIAANTELAHCIEQLRSGYFSPSEPEVFRELCHNLVSEDRFMVCADYADYIRAQYEVDKAYRDEERWSRMVLLNIAGSGKFSSDRTVLEYAREMWAVEPSEIKLPQPSKVAQDKPSRFYIGP